MTDKEKTIFHGWYEEKSAPDFKKITAEIFDLVNRFNSTKVPGEQGQFYSTVEWHIKNLYEAGRKAAIDEAVIKIIDWQQSDSSTKSLVTLKRSILALKESRIMERET